MTDLTALPWRQGRHLYAQAGPRPSDDDPLVGTLDTAELAAEACESHNERLAARVMAQAAARLYPGEFRLMGEAVGEREPARE